MNAGPGSDEVINQVAWALHCWTCPLCWANGMEAMASSATDHVTETDRHQAAFVATALGLTLQEDR